MILQSLLELQIHGQLRISQEKEEKTNGSYGSRSRSGYRLDRGDTVRGGRSLDTPDRRTSMHGHHSISSSSTHHHSHHCHHPYRRGEYLPEEFNKVKPHAFDGEMKKSEDAEAWLLGMNKFFRLHSYLKDMKVRITTFNLKKRKQIFGGKM